MRADVRRNRARLLAAAREMFERDGAGASLEGVARLAGVGIGTLYRHFPTRQDLLEALLADVYDGLAATGRELLVSPAPGEALTTWLRAFIARTTAFPGMAASAVMSLRDERPGRSGASAACRAMRDAGEALFARARDAGDVPADAVFADALRLTGAIAVVTEREPETADRLLALAATGLVSGKAAH
ncbi:TetR/AcrR family transcriptional regulator [Actinomadura soli]|uniref:TetR/AcrR family transcriptional regulator n=2 Tax=Actinomadura soli TaxID=2508997 RepID=A0A5C4JDZ1_9ACTN|nr:TetR/AcrR family transcriptional regulator [Actinomadura soli]